MNFEHSGYHKGAKSIDIKKIILQLFRCFQIDTFSYNDHSNPMRIGWDRAREKKVPFFFLVGVLTH